MINMRKVLAAILLLIVALSSPAAAASNVCRDLPSGVQTAGTTISVDLEVTLGGADTYLIDDCVPSGWEITAAPGGSISDDGITVTYFAFAVGSDKTLTYQVAIPSGASSGQYCFTGQFGIGTGDMGPITCGDMCVDVGEAPVGETPEDIQDTSQDGAASGGEISIPGPLPTATPEAIPNETGTQPVSGETVTSAPSVTPTASEETPVTTSTKKLATKPETKGLLPGFEAVFVIAGLLAVVYVLRRR